jgi:hypothetical protein
LFINLEASYKDKSKLHVFLDTARYHYNTAVKEWLATSGRRIILTLFPAFEPNRAMVAHPAQPRDAQQIPTNL